MNTEELLKLLVCPKCRQALKFVETGQRRGFACDHCLVVYPIENDIPVMLVEEAIPQAKWKKGI